MTILLNRERLNQHMKRIIILLAALLLIAGCSGTMTEQGSCEEQGGEWKTFPDACADFCNAGDMCAQVLTESCDCGPDECWDGQKCIEG